MGEIKLAVLKSASEFEENSDKLREAKVLVKNK